MPAECLVKYYGINEEKELQPVVCDNFSEIKELPQIYFISDPGLYSFAGKFWNIDEEGLYRFIDANGSNLQYCYYKEDTDALVKAIILSSDFSGTNKTEPADKNEYLKEWIYTDKNKFSYDAFLSYLLSSHVKIPYRLTVIYSLSNQSCQAVFWEIWDKSEICWKLYFLEGHVSFGRVDKHRTAFDVFEEIIEERCSFTVLAKREQHLIAHDLLEEKGLLQEYNDALLDMGKLGDFFKRHNTTMFFIENIMETECYAEEKHKKELMDTTKIALWGKDFGDFEISHVDDEYIRMIVYQPQTFVLPGKIIKIPK